MFCPTCGFDCKDENFCPKCGRNLKSIAENGLGSGKKASTPPKTVQPQPLNPNCEDFVISSQFFKFLFAAIFFTIYALTSMLILIESKESIVSILLISSEELEADKVWDIISALSIIVIAVALWGIRVQSVTKQAIAPAWFYIIFGAILVNLFLNLVIGIKTFSVITQSSLWSRGDNDSLGLKIYAYAYLAGVLLLVIIDGIAAKIIAVAARGEEISNVFGISFLKVILQIFGWLGAILGVLLVKEDFFQFLSVVSSSIARILFGKILSDYTYYDEEAE